MRLFIPKEGLAIHHGSLQKEWIETNGLGSYGMSSITGANTRKYHGWLNIADGVRGEKFVLLSKVDPTLIVHGETYELGFNKYPGTFHPNGISYQKYFEHDLFPTTCFEIKEHGIELLQSLLLVDGENRLIIRYQLKNSKDSVRLRLTPLMAYRGIHALAKQNPDLRFTTYEIPEPIGVKRAYKAIPYNGMPELYLSSDDEFEIRESHCWYNNIEYEKELSRGFDYQEDLFSLCHMERELKPGEDLFISFSTELPKYSLRKLFHRESERRLALSLKYGAKTHLGALKQGAEKFILKNSKGNLSITAGLPWFNEWGRDAMISIPGLTFYCDYFDKGIEILKTWCSYEKDGILPNYLPLKTSDTPSYNSVDASMWFFWAVSEYYELTKDKETIACHFQETMKRVISAYLDGKVPFAELTLSGLIYAGDKETQLTWMDAMVNGSPVTPRYGMAVEINALWYHAVSFYLDLFADKSDFSERLFELKETIRQGFLLNFWSEERGYLADVVNEEGADFSIRPNQIFAVSLNYSPLDQNQMLKVVDKVKDELLTPFGLRTLSPRDPRFVARYEGDSKARDGAYHQGTVWPWPIGHFTEAFLRVSSNRANASKFLRDYFETLITSHLTEDGLFSVAEIFDGNAPHRPNGCPAQAWSVAETIRAFELMNGFKKREKVPTFMGKLVKRFK